MLLQAGQLLSTFGSGMSSIAYPLLALAVTGSAANAGYVGAAEFLPLVLLSLPAGVAADRFDRRALMIAADVVGVGAVGVLAAVVLVHHVALWIIIAVAFADSAAAVVFRAGFSGAFRAVVPQAQLADASSLAQARAATVRLTAPPAGGALFGLSRAFPFLADAISYAFSTLSLVLIRTRFQEEKREQRSTSLREGLAFFWGMPFLRTTVGMIAASNFAASGIPLALIILAKRHGLPAAAIGGFVAAAGASTLVGSALSPLLRRRLPMRVILLSEFWMAIVYAAFIGYPSVYVLAAAFALHAFCFPNTDSAVAAYSYALIPDRLLGRGMAAANTLRAITTPIGPLAAGLLLTHTSPRIAVAVLAVPVLAAAALGSLSDSLRELPSLNDSIAAQSG
jgi:MFS family permease